MGMRGREVPTGVEIPIATPVILAGLRTSAVQIVATATLVAVVGGGALGAVIIAGFNTGDEVRIFGSATVVALLAIFTDRLSAYPARGERWPAPRVERAGADRTDAAVTRGLTASDGPLVDCPDPDRPVHVATGPRTAQEETHAEKPHARPRGGDAGAGHQCLLAG